MAVDMDDGKSYIRCPYSALTDVVSASGNTDVEGSGSSYVGGTKTTESAADVSDVGDGSAGASAAATGSLAPGVLVGTSGCPPSTSVEEEPL